MKNVHRESLLLFALFFLILSFGPLVWGQEAVNSDESAPTSEKSAPEKLSPELNAKPDESSLSQDKSDKDSGKKSKRKKKKRTKNASRRSLKVQWYHPSMSWSDKKDRVRVRFSGKTKPGTQIGIGADTLAIIDKNGQVSHMDTKDLTVGKGPVVALGDGYFLLELDLPIQRVQLPLRLEGKKGEMLNLILALNLDRDKIEVTNLKDLKKSPYTKKNFNLWGGAGFNYLSFSQSDDSGDFSFDSFKGPSFFAKGEVQINERWGIGITANSSPGATSSSTNLKVKQATYNWVFSSVEAMNLPRNWKGTTWGLPHEFGWRAGIQYHLIPTLIRSGTSVNEFDLKTNGVTFVSFGPQYFVHISHKWVFEWFMRYQYPLASGGLGGRYKISPQFAFDGSVGIFRKMSSSWRWGLFWYGQSHNFGFENYDEYLLSQSQSPKIDGNQSLFFSNLELRVGYSFD